MDRGNLSGLLLHPKQVHYSAEWSNKRSPAHADVALVPMLVVQVDEYCRQKILHLSVVNQGQAF